MIRVVCDWQNALTSRLERKDRFYRKQLSEKASQEPG